VAQAVKDWRRHYAGAHRRNRVLCINSIDVSEVPAGSMKAELEPFSIQVQVINPGGYLTGFNETEAESSSHWMDDREKYIKLDTVTTFFSQILSTDDNRMDPQLMADAMVSIIPEDTGLFRNVAPKATDELARSVQRELWNARIDRSPDMRR
jgi:hypothetical protein